MSDLVTALLARRFPAAVALVKDPFQIVINRGADDGLKLGQRFLIFGIGDEVIDPQTQESLGALELVRGTGVVSHLQAKMAVLDSDRRGAPTKRVVRQPMLSFATEETILDSSSMLPFQGVQVGDFVRPI